MHRAEFSEFTYSFAVTMDLMQKFYGDARRPTGQIWLPFFPNLRDERFLGFDVLLDLPARAIPIALQYKLSTQMKRLPPEVKLVSPFFRSEINFQQNLTLLQLQQKFQMDIYYCAPVFISLLDLQNHFSAGQVAEHSVFAVPPNLPASEPPDHKMYFDRMTDGYYCSKPVKLQVCSYPNLIQPGTADINVSQFLKALAVNLMEKGIKLPTLLLSDEVDAWRDFFYDSPEYIWRFRDSIRFAIMRSVLALNFGVDFFLVGKDKLQQVVHAPASIEYMRLFD